MDASVPFAIVNDAQLQSIAGAVDAKELRVPNELWLRFKAGASLADQQAILGRLASTESPAAHDGNRAASRRGAGGGRRGSHAAGVRQRHPRGRVRSGARLSALGFAVTLVLGARARAVEFAVLRAVGSSGRQILRGLVVEWASCWCWAPSSA